MNEGWKRWLIKSAGFGAGFALTLAALVGGLVWYSSRPERPKPWDKSAVKAEYTGVIANTDNPKIELAYTLENTRDSDYTIRSLDSVKLAWLKNDGSLTLFNQLADFDVPVFIPAKHKVDLILQLNFGSWQRVGFEGSPKSLTETLDDPEFRKLSPGAQRIVLDHYGVSKDMREKLLEKIRKMSASPAAQKALESHGEYPSEQSYKKAVIEYLTNRAKNLNGFVLLDESVRYEIDFPPGWKKAPESKENPPPPTGPQ